MSLVPLKWAGGDRARWRGRDVVVEYAADDAALVSYIVESLHGSLTIGERLAGHLERGHRLRFSIVSLSDLELRLPD